MPGVVGNWCPALLSLAAHQDDVVLRDLGVPDLRGGAVELVEKAGSKVQIPIKGPIKSSPSCFEANFFCRLSTSSNSEKI